MSASKLAKNGSSASSFDIMPRRAELTANQTEDVTRAVFAEQLKADGLEKYTNDDNLHVKDPKLKDVGRMIREAGDKLDRDHTYQKNVSKLSPDNPEESFATIMRELFNDGVYTWGRIVMLFSFGYKLFKKSMEATGGGVVDVTALLTRLMKCVVQYIIDHVVDWIASHGGWTELLNGVGPTNTQVALVCVAALIAVGAVYIHMHRT